jgi:hypothetical protein
VTEIETDYDVLMRRVASGELGAGNLVTMILEERARNARLADAVKEWATLYNVERARTSATPAASIDELVELILWLALPWGENDPLFPESDGWTPAALEANRRMARTWARVVRGNQSPGAVPDERGDTDGIESNS